MKMVVIKRPAPLHLAAATTVLSMLGRARQGACVCVCVCVCAERGEGETGQ